MAREEEEGGGGEQAPANPLYPTLLKYSAHIIKFNVKTRTESWKIQIPAVTAEEK